jgi:hypothetical protein
MTEAQKFALTYPTIINAKNTYERVVPVLEKIFEYRDKGERFTVAMIGEAIMGAKKYHETHLDRTTWNGEKIYTRSKEALSLSSTIGSILHKMRNRKMVTYTTEKDMAHPHTFETEEYGYVLNGKPIPDVMEVDTEYGQVRVHASNIKGVTSARMKREVTRYPSIDWYSFI